MKLLNIFALACILILSLESCHEEPCNFEVGVGGILETTESGIYKDGTHYIGDTTEWAGHSVLICHDPNINLDDYVGQYVKIHGNYIHEQSLNVPKLIDVIHVHVE